MNRHEIDIEQWNRREHFEWFNSFQEPFAGITAQIDVTEAYHFAHRAGFKFSLVYFYLSLKAANEVENMRYRIESGHVYCYDAIGGDTTIIREDTTYGCAHFSWHDSYADFQRDALQQIAHVQQTPGLTNDYVGCDTIYYSTVPWIHFTAINHPRCYSVASSVPRITFGKVEWQGDRLWLPVDLHFHHALMDGYHASCFFERFQHDATIVEALIGH